jgi:hypothetical protein
MPCRVPRALALLVVAAAAQPASVHGVVPPAGSIVTDTVHVAAPTGVRDADRASILAALGQVQPDGTIQFAAGTYLIGEIISFPTPGITLLGHPGGTTRHASATLAASGGAAAPARAARGYRGRRRIRGSSPAHVSVWAPSTSPARRSGGRSSTTMPLASSG